MENGENGRTVAVQWLSQVVPSSPKVMMEWKKCGRNDGKSRAKVGRKRGGNLLENDAKRAKIPLFFVLFGLKIFSGAPPPNPRLAFSGSVLQKHTNTTTWQPRCGRFETFFTLFRTTSSQRQQAVPKNPSHRACWLQATVKPDTRFTGTCTRLHCCAVSAATVPCTRQGLLGPSPPGSLVPSCARTLLGHKSSHVSGAGPV